MSYMYYDVRKMIKEKYKEEFGRSKEETSVLILYVFGCLIAIVIPMVLLIFKQTKLVLKIIELNIYWALIIFVIVIGGVIAIKSLYKASKISKSHNIRAHVIEVKNALVEVGVDNTKKIEMLKEEITIQNEKEDRQLEEMKNLIIGILKTTLIVPIGFLFGIFFQSEESIVFDDVISLSLVLLSVCLLMIGVIVQIYPTIKSILFISRKDREKVYQYLYDIEYLETKTRLGRKYKYK